MRYLLIISLLWVLSSCSSVDYENVDPVLKPASFKDLRDWQKDDHAQTLIAFKKSCERILKKSPQAPFSATGIGGTYGDWQPLCRHVVNGKVANARTFFEDNFTPYQVKAGSWQDTGLFTGYYEPLLRGSRQQHGRYQYPLRKRPGDLVMVNLGEFRDDLKGRRIAGRVVNGQLQPYEDRRDIEDGKLSDQQAWPFVWVDDPVDAFFLHIQGSGRVQLDNGQSINVGYDGQNGHPYYAIGRELIARGELDKDEVSLQTIRRWLHEHLDQSYDLMMMNQSYVFFKELQGEGPLGGEGVALTAGRSLAVDRARIPYGVPIWLDAEAPTDKDKPLRSLMVAQDTGGAIRGPVRGDVFWGYGDVAEFLAGHMKSKGKMWLLLPKAH